MARSNWFSSRRASVLKPRLRRKSQGFRSRWKSQRLQLETLEDRLVLSATVATDLADYRPGATAHIFASDFAIGEAVQFQVLHNDGTPNTGNGHLPWTVVDGSVDDLDGLVDGNVHTTWYVDPDDSNGSSFDLSAFGLNSGWLATTTFTDVGSTLSQFANKPATQYQTGSLNSSNSAYVEGGSIPFRYLVSDLREGASVVLDIIYQFQSSAAGPRTYDFLTSDTASEAITDTERFGPSNASSPSGFGLTSSTNLVLAPIPNDPSITTDTGGNFRVASNVPVIVTSVSTPAISSSPDEKHIVIVIQLGNDGDATPNEDIVDLGVFWGGHLARDTDYAGANNGAADASGASFHMRAEGFQDLNGNGIKNSGDDNLGGGDRSINTGAIVHTTLAWEKRRADTNALQGGATFTVTSNPFTGSGSLTVVDDTDGVTGPGDIDHDPDPGQLLLEDIFFGTYTITEVVAPTGFLIDPASARVQSVTSASPNAVVGTQGQNDAGTTNESDFHNPVATPAINVEKLVNGQDADTTSGQPILAVGSTATFTYVVTNTGNVALSGVVVVDDNGTPANTADDFNATFVGGDANGNGLLDLTETWTFTASRIVTAGQYTNIGKATGQGAGQTAMDTDPANHFGAAPAIDIEKLVNGQDADTTSGQPILAVGSTATFTYVVTNTGNIALSSVVVVDDNGTPGTLADDFNATFTGGDANSNGLLDLTETWTFTASRIVTAGQYTNIGKATGQAAGQTAMDTDPANHFGAAPAIDIEKLVNGQDADLPTGPIVPVGSTATFTYVVTNTGNIALSNVVVVDDNGTPANLADDFNATFTGGDTNGNGQLDLSETWTFTASRIVTAGQYTNIGKATGQAANQTVMDTDPANHFGARAAIDIEKLVNGEDADSPTGPIVPVGSTATFTYVVTNTGNIALSNVSVVDDNGTPGNVADDFNATFTGGDTNGNALQDLGETWTFTASRIVTAGQYTNMGKASGQAAGQTVMDTDPANHFGAAPAIDVEKLVNGQDADTTSGQPILAVGSTATFTYLVTNTGNIALSNVVVVDDNGTPANLADDFNATFTGGDTNANGLLDLSETWTFTASRIVTEGQHTNIGKASGQAAGQTVMDTDPANHFGAAPAIDIEKLVNGQDADLPTGPIVPVGSTATFSYVVTNTGNIALSNVVVVDDNGTPANLADDFNPSFTGGDANSNGLLDLGETWAYAASRIVTAGQYTNIAKASGQAAGQTAMDTDAANHFGKRDPIIVIGPDKGITSFPIVKLVNQETGNTITQFYVYEPNFLGGVRIATGDMTGDGIDEIIVAPGQGRVGEVRVFTQLGAELTQFRTLPYGAAYYGGVEVAVGDVNGDGKNDIVTTPSYGRTEVRVFFNNYDSGNPSADPIANSPDKQFFVFASSFLGGADVIVADVGTFNNGATLDALTPDGKGEIIVGNGPGMRSTIVVFDVTGAPSVVDTILPLSNSFKGGITLSAARINGDAIPDIIVAAGNKGGSIVEIRSGVTNDATDVLLAAFSAFGDTATKNAPVHATALDTNGDGISDLLAVVQGTNGTSNQIRYFSTAGAWLGSHSGFFGPWNIASLNNVDPSLPDSTAITPAARDQAYNEIATTSSMTKKAAKKLAKAKKKK